MPLSLSLRILELSEPVPTPDGDLLKSVELWDCSGDQKYEPCWPAICDRLDGAIVAFDPTNKSQANDVRIWCEWFCKRANLHDGQVTIFAHGELSGTHKPLSVRAGGNTVIAPIVNVSTQTSHFGQTDEEGRTILTPAQVEFRQFLGMVYQVTQGQGNQEANNEGDY